MSGGTRSFEMARRMVAQGHEVHMVTSQRNASDAKGSWYTTEEEGIHVHWYPVPYSNHMSYPQRVKAFVLFAYQARRKVLSLNGDVIFATSTPLTIALPAVPASKKKNIPLVFEVRDLWPELPIAMNALKNPILKYVAHKLERWAYTNSSAVVALSPGMKRGVVDTGYPSSRVAVIPNSSDNLFFKHNAIAATEFRSSREWLGDKPLLVYTGTFGKLNGVGYLVDLAVALKDINSDIQILLVGDGQEREKVMLDARKSGVYGENLFIEQRIPKKDIPALLSAATFATSLFIDLPEMQSNSANKFFDSLASGTPVLINYGGWMNELVQSRKCGLSVWKQPVTEVAALLNDKAGDKQWLDQASKAARDLAENEFSRDKLANQLLEVISLSVNGKADRVSEVTSGYC